MRVNHLNYVSEDSGKVYCRKRNKVVELNDNQFSNHCSSCPMFAGSLQGEGVECVWTDNRQDVEPIHSVTSPEVERNSLIVYDETKKKEKFNINKG